MEETGGSEKGTRTSPAADHNGEVSTMHLQEENTCISQDGKAPNGLWKTGIAYFLWFNYT